jgi:hypothetical protein
MIRNVTAELNKLLLENKGVQEALTVILGNELFGRETKSAALGEISEHLVAVMVSGIRCSNGNKGHDIIDHAGAKVEVKTRLPGEYGAQLLFSFSKHTASANEIFCVCWESKEGEVSIVEAYRMLVSDIAQGWLTPNQKRYFARMDLKKLRIACSRVV